MNSKFVTALHTAPVLKHTIELISSLDELVKIEESTSMKLSKFFPTLVCVLALAVSGSFLVRPHGVRALDGEAYAIKGATVVTVTGATIPKGTVVIRNGLIVAVGADVQAPADARVIDGTGMTVYPGLFDAHSSYGVRQTEAPAGAGGGRGATQVADPAQAFLARMSAAP